MMKRTKKGVTLVELVICCGIMVMLGAACTALIASSSSAFNTGVTSANAQLEADVLQAYLLECIPSTKNMEQVSAESAANLPSGCSLFFNQDGDCIFRRNGKDTIIRSISEISYEIIPAGAPLPVDPDDPDAIESVSASVRAQFVYTAKLTDGSSFKGGFVMCNLSYATLTGTSGFSGTIKGDLSTDKPITFLVPVSST